MDLGKRGIIIIVTLLFVISFISSDFEVTDESYLIEKTYGPGDDLSGWINISFDDEPSNSVVEDSFENSINLIDLIKSNQDFDYNCTTKNCTSDYKESNPSTTKNFNLLNQQSKLTGLKFSGKITSIDSVDFFLDSDASWSCYNQIEIDLLNDGVIDFGNDKSSTQECSYLRSYGCFNDNVSLIEPTIGTIPYCQRVDLFKSPGFKLGAWVKEESSGNKNLTMTLYNLDGDKLETCELSKEQISSGKEINCEVNYLVTKAQEYYVCISSDEGTGTYRTRGYSGNVNCGFNNFPKSFETSSYQIFAQGLSFAPLGSLNISNSLPDGSSLNAKISDYISGTYGSLDCTNDCIVPIRIISGKDQQITIRNLKVKFSREGFPGLDDDKFYDLNETPSVISSSFQKLYFDEAEFTLPTEIDTYDYEITLDDDTIYDDEVIISRVPIIDSINPTKTASAYPTKFTVEANSATNLTAYEWDFGDGTTDITLENEIVHTYASSGDYNLKLTIKDTLDRKTSKEFVITVEPPNQVINSSIKENLMKLENIENKINEYDSFTKKEIYSILDIDSLNSEMTKIEREFKLAFLEEEYNQLMNDLLNIEIPDAIITTKNANSILFFPKKSSIDLYTLETIGGGSYDIEDEDKYLNSVLFWNQENIDTKVSFKEISAKYKANIVPLLSVYEINIAEKQTPEGDPYFIIRKLDDLKFKEDYLENEESGYIFTEIKGDQEIVFSTTERIDFIDLPLFISPSINSLSITPSTFPQYEPDFSKWIFFILIVFLLFVIGFITYVVLQIWYKNKYETHLFQNRNNLYNLLVYIQNARKRGLKDSAIAKKLKNAGWKSEQVNYALKKHAGKRTGMLEIPISKILGKVKKKKYPEKNQGASNTGRRIR